MLFTAAGGEEGKEGKEEKEQPSTSKSRSKSKKTPSKKASTPEPPPPAEPENGELPNWESDERYDPEKMLDVSFLKHMKKHSVK